MRKPTIYEALRDKLGREPTNAELKADVDRIKRGALVDLAGKGKLAQQRGTRTRTKRAHARKKSPSPAQMDREIADFMKANPYVRSESEKQIHPEVFACLDRNGKILGTSRTVRGAMSLAPDDTSYAIIRGEYTSDGSNWGVGRGKQHAVREGSSRRWQQG